MARDHGRILSSIWYEDGDWRHLDGAAQRLYLMLISEPNLTWAGTLPLTIRRWSTTCVDLTVELVMDQLRILSNAKYVVVDEDTEEVLVRTLIKNDRVYRQPKVLMAARDHATKIASRRIRHALADELSTVPLDDLSVSVREQVEPMLKALVETLSEGLPEPYREPFAEPIAEGIGNPHARGRSRSMSMSMSIAPAIAPTPDSDSPAELDAPEHDENDNGGGETTDEELLRAIAVGRKRAGKDPAPWTLTACQAAATKADIAGLFRPGEDPRDLLLALAADQKTDLPARLATDAGIAVARAIAADRRRDQARQRAEAATRREGYEAEARAELDAGKRDAALRQRLTALGPTERDLLVDDARQLAAARSGVDRAPRALVDATLLELLDQRKAVITT